MMLDANPHIDIDEEPTARLVARFNKHVQSVSLNTITTRYKLYHIFCAKGLHKLLAERAVTLDDDEAGNVALGAPHWVTFNAGTLDAMLSEANDGAK